MTRNGLIPVERRTQVLTILQNRHTISIQELASALQASPSTIRRDLEYLTKLGHAVRTHGGAVYVDRLGTTFEPGWTQQARTSLEEKSQIARMALSRIKPGLSIILDSSSTVFEVAKLALAHQVPLTVVTNDLNIAAHLTAAKAIRLIVTGGLLRPRSFTLTGEPADDLLARLHADIALIGVHAIGGGRLSDTSMDVAAIKRRMIAAAERAIVLADHTKFSAQAFCEIVPLRSVHEIITDSGLDPREAARIQEEHGVRVTRARMGGDA